MDSQTEEERDQRILDITRELCSELGISKYNPSLVSWKMLYGLPGKKATPEFPPDDCTVRKDSVTLPESMRDKLEPDEFRPIIASSLIFSKTFRRRIFEGFFLSAVPYILLAVSLFFELPILLPSPNTVCKSGSCETSPLGVQIGRIAPLLVTPVFVIIFMTYLRRKEGSMQIRRLQTLLTLQCFLPR